MTHLTSDQEDLLIWLSESEFSQYGECYGKSLDVLVEHELAKIHGNGEHQVFIAKGNSDMHRAVSLTEKGLSKVANIKSQRHADLYECDRTA